MDSDLIKKRLLELDKLDAIADKEIEHQQRIKAANADERKELFVAAKVFARLTGSVETQEFSQFEKRAVQSADRHVADLTLPEMISKVLEAMGGKGMEPKEISDKISESWMPDVVVNNVASSCWRMWKQGRLTKDEGTKIYRLPQTNEPPDEKLGSEASEGSLFNPDPEAQGVKAAPGGGP
ncbi:hypothetical protein [uncultured Marivita sp.]|uniref:hypothetical protein n=1 Tax=uncultured Marivita sp. TaxID=888080 RepID=UPI002609B32D|nr:hypothetical protein [uncultured Marivita sp.]